MTWGEFRTFLWGSAVILLDAVTAPIYRILHHHSHRN